MVRAIQDKNKFGNIGYIPYLYIMNETWKEFNYNGTIYKCSNLGNITDINNYPLKIRIDKDGYERVRLYNKCKETKDKRTPKTLHRLIYAAFNPTIDMTNLTINHIDGNKLNNNLNNLELISIANNNKHAYRIGLKNHKGENHPKAIFSEKQILEIRNLYHNKIYNQTQLATLFNTKQPRISEIIKLKSWAHLT